MKITSIIAINCFFIIVNFLNCFDKALTEIFQFCMALVCMMYEVNHKVSRLNFATQVW